ncbi:hypothetical protein E3P92_00272 [Wallemia ichthyophaga]|uniref:Photolyase/cryptochrome alpha/beta domain-containing protein n=2 Tax=Wallemia ichthyophaga TaxID=245174 RepID=A0A4T0HJT0_WALIC|nr:Deoxyribodipyrimidine photo-lyase [Wallemia ichthyophaga EXF-994]TIA75368.1 hypothetical protein E3P91_00548 [Wallemia ichthyophaga]EOR04978.1 Deoxyribodipyrimidine photo-lyase [Wallemia ichthyophaga EXF-994]TIA84088.1 hypothetical protein E3P98_00414 [Wallemia ichthyophaga]TIA93541.1 hypothetical protein E3P97_00964 [Wallemia ichthyophaga]TIA97071.1 hypothetical protein E3P95_03004 [Wallemia ichthyophaga]
MGNLKKEPSSPIQEAGVKRAATRSPSPHLHENKKQTQEKIKKEENLGGYPSYGRVKACSIAKADRIDENPPVLRLNKAIQERTKQAHSDDEKSVVFWMRMHDLRIVDSRGLTIAYEYAKEHNIPLIIIHVFSPQDYEAHDRSCRRIDFVLRKLKSLKEELEEMNIPLYTFTVEQRQHIPQKVIDFVKQYNSKHLYGNIEYEIDELFRDMQLINLANEQEVEVQLEHDNMVVPPFKVLTKTTSKPPMTFTAYLKGWQKIVLEDPTHRDETERIGANNISAKEDYKALFEKQVPDEIAGFECHDKDKMRELWPVGRTTASEILDRFLHYKNREEATESTPLGEGAEKDDRNSRIKQYADGRNITTGETTSKISPYLASGQISVRQCFNRAQKLKSGYNMDITRESGVGMWSQEVIWKDFYQNVLCVQPRVSMGHPFLRQYRFVEWEYNQEHLDAWHQGKTGWPIVDAAMRQLTTTGWMHNRMRMTVASYLCKDLMLDWREGERIFAKELIDHDLGSNNGGWQWSAGTGTDAQPYFRIFNPISQSQKADPSGEYIHHWLPELRDIKPPALFEPSKHLSKNEFQKLNYPKPLVDHKFARDRALSRYKKALGKE